MFVLPVKKAARREFALILLITAIPVIPTVLLGYHHAHDLEIHLQSWMDAAQQMRHGTLFPRWANEANYGFGEPRFIFYPPLSWMMGAILGLLLPWKMVPAVFIWLTLILAALCMRTLARDWLPRREAFFAGLLYALNPYMLVSAFTRCAFGELLASAFFPLLLFGAFRLERERGKAFGIVALAMAAIWLSNLPAGVFAGYSLSCILLVLAIVRRSWRALLVGSLATAAGIGLAAFSLLPAAVERSWVNIGAVFDREYRPEANFLFTQNDTRAMSLFNHRVSLLAVLLIFAGLTVAILAWRLRQKAPALWWSLTSLGAISSLLMIRWSSPLWRTLPELYFVQFPWRWLFPLCTAVTLLVTLSVSASKRNRVLWPGVACVVAVVGVGIVHTKQWYPRIPDEIAEKFASGRGYAGLPEYTPITNETLALPKEAPFVSPAGWRFEPTSLAGAKVYVENWSAERKEICAELAHPMAVELKLLAYPGWNVTVDGKPVALQANPQTDQVQISLPAGVSRIELRFQRTLDRTIGMGVSLFTAGALALAEFFLRRRKGKPEEQPAELARAA